MMQSQKITINDLQNEETGWKELILLNELHFYNDFPNLDYTCILRS